MTTPANTSAAPVASPVNGRPGLSSVVDTEGAGFSVVSDVDTVVDSGVVVSDTAGAPGVVVVVVGASGVVVSDTTGASGVVVVVVDSGVVVVVVVGSFVVVVVVVGSFVVVVVVVGSFVVVVVVVGS